MAEIGALDSSNELSMLEANRLQTDLAIASLNVAYLVARRELARRHGRFRAGPRIAIYGLGRLASGGVDYGSDLDILITYDSLVPSPINALTPDQAYARFVELMITALERHSRGLPVSHRLAFATTRKEWTTRYQLRRLSRLRERRERAMGVAGLCEAAHGRRRS